MSLHDVYMIHGAQANTSGKRRTGAALRYMPSTSVFERDLRPPTARAACRSTSRAARCGW
jgi:ectoine hydroxylase-related dioxygenase (phytanoyl-CoA dioxygenase family)